MSFSEEGDLPVQYSGGRICRLPVGMVRSHEKPGREGEGDRMTDLVGRESVLAGRVGVCEASMKMRWDGGRSVEESVSMWATGEGVSTMIDLIRIPIFRFGRTLVLSPGGTL